MTMKTLSSILVRTAAYSWRAITSPQGLIFIAACALFLALAHPAHAGAVGDPYTGTPISINSTPGGVTYFEAENFDKGGEGVAYHDPKLCTAGGVCACTQTYRPDGVNVCTTGAAVYISTIYPGLYVDYTIKVAAGANYTVELFISFLDIYSCCAAAAYHVELDGQRYPTTGSYALGPKPTASWYAFEWRGLSEAMLIAPGIHRLRIVADQPSFNLDAIRITYAYGIEWVQVPVWKKYTP
jgi:hypothetical protein